MTDQPTPQTEARTVLAAALDRAQSQDHTTGMTYWPDVIISVLEDNGLAIEAQAHTEALDVDALAEVLSYFGHEYDVDGRMEWHSLNCIYRKTWPMYDDPSMDNLGCIKVRSVLAAKADR